MRLTRHCVITRVDTTLVHKSMRLAAFDPGHQLEENWSNLHISIVSTPGFLCAERTTHSLMKHSAGRGTNTGSTLADTEELRRLHEAL